MFAACRTVTCLTTALVLFSACGEKTGTEVVSTLPEGGFVDDGCATDLDCELGEFCIANECVARGDECSADADCAGQQECRGGYCVDRAAGCEDDDGCDEGEICEDGECLFGCREDGDCGPGRMCNTNTNQCFTPPEDCGGACPAHTVCNTRTGECVSDGTCSEDDDCAQDQSCREGVCEDGARCSENIDCPSGQWCNRSAGFCEVGCRQANECRVEEVCVEGQCTETLPNCAQDVFEPNGSEEAAASVLPPEDFEGLTLCGDEDWYAFTAFDGDEVEIEARFVNDLGNINMQLFDTEGRVLQLVAGQTNLERISRTLDSTGTHHLRVFGAGRGVFTGYDLSFDLTRNCDEDDSEENDTAEEATPIDAALRDRFVCGADDDWYSVELFSGETLVATMDFEQALGELGLELYSDEEALIEVAEAGEEGRKSITFSASTAVKVLLKVPGAQGVVNRYDLAAEIQSPPCQDDEAEDDDGPEQARSASPGDIIEGAVCAGDEDWFAFVLPADVVFAPSLSFSHLDGDLLLELFSADGETLLASSDTLTDEESIEHLVALPGLHHLKVSGNGRAQGAYVLEAAGGGDSRCPGDDAQEDNDDFESPALIEPGRQGDLIMCQGDEDWYRFELEEGQSAEVFVLAAAESGALNVALFGPAALSDGDDPVDEALGEGVVKRVRVQAGTPAGAYLLRVVGAREDDVPYSVRLDVYEGPLPLGCEFDDAFEDNDLVSDAVRLEGRQTHDGILCGEDVDWFRFDAEVGDIVSVRVDFLHEEGDLNLTLHGGTPLVPLAQSLSADDGEFLQHRVEQAGPLFAELALGSGESAVYALTISSIRGSLPQSCVTDDLFEQNDGFDTATEVDAGSITAIHCSEDDDFFSVSLLAGQTLRARLMHEGEEGLELALYEGVDQPVAQAEALGSAIKVLEFTAEQGLDGALGVSSGLPRDAAYTLTFEILDAVPQRCGEEDANEPDDDPGVATAVTESSEFGEQTLCGADEDWYEITLPAGHRLVAEVRFDPLLGNLESEVYDQLGGGLGASYSTSDVERLELGSVNVERQVFLRTFLADEGEVSSLDYTLAITIENDELCSPDVNEDNNTSRTATRISRGNQDGLSICGEDEDWFLINLNQPLSTVVVTIEFDGEAADLDLVLYQESLMFELARSSGVGDREVIMETVVFPGPHLIQVFRFDGGSTDYSLRVTVR